MNLDDLATEGGSLSGINLAATGISKLLKGISQVSSSFSPIDHRLISTPQTNTPVVPSMTAVPVTSSIFASKPLASTPTATPAYNTSLTSSGRVAASLTSTAAPTQTTTENALWDEEDLMFEAVQAKGDKGFVRLVTNFGQSFLDPSYHSKSSGKVQGVMEIYAASRRLLELRTD